MAESARIVIVGGGVIGLSVAYHLADRGVTDVLLIERNQLTSGTSWHAAGIVGPLRASLNLTHLARYATELFPQLEQKTGQSSGYQQTGGYWLARNDDRMTELRRIAHMGDVTGLHVDVIGPQKIAEKLPWLDTAGLAGALWVEEDGQANPVDICAAYARHARAKGIRIRENTACAGFEMANGRVMGVKLAGGETIRCDMVVNCAGAWARDLGALARVPVPLQAVEHMYVVTEPVPDLPAPVPILRDLDKGIYIKGDSGKLVLGGFEPFAKPFDTRSVQGVTPFLELPEDWEQFEPFMEAGLALVPKLGTAGIRHFMNGPESFTPDTRPLLGESPYLRGFFVAAGFNSTGMMSSAGAGKAMAEWLIDGAPALDLWALDIARFDRASASRAYLTRRTEETVADLFRMHWPYKQAGTGRDVRRSAFHARFAEAGAVFGAPTGWERPLWFARDGEAREPHYSYGAQYWWPAAEREAKTMTEGAGLFELSPFTKIDMKGAGALPLLQFLCVNEIDVLPGRAVYTQMLNRHGGIEADVTVTRFSENHFRVTSGAVSRQKDVAWIARHAEDGNFHAAVTDVTSAEAVLAVVGPRSRELLQSLSESDLSTAALPFGHSLHINVGSIAVRATRVSFTGELGYELYVPVESGEALLQSVLDAGGSFGLACCGHYALDGCRLEKGYLHWGHDMGPKDTLLEAGLSLPRSKTGFLGEAAVRKQKDEGLTRQLLHFAVKDARPLLLHDEPIFRDGKLAGLTTSGGQGFRTGLALCLGSVTHGRGEDRASLLKSSYEIAVAGERFSLVPLAEPPFDPAGRRLRS